MRIEAVQGDITTQDVDVVVNAANSSLLGGGGVDGAIHAAAGPELLAACREVRRTTYPDGLAPGDAVATPGFGLPARWVVHTVGPNRHAGQVDPWVLASCFTRSLEIAVQLDARSIAFPAVSAGVYGWDVREVARVGVGAARTWQGGVEAGWQDGHPRPHGVELVRFVLFSAAALAAFEHVLAAGDRPRD
ncbi:O-acetyl-ADP-ribose deacetylase [Cellulomonas sp. URHB0016]